MGNILARLFRKESYAGLLSDKANRHQERGQRIIEKHQEVQDMLNDDLFAAVRHQDITQIKLVLLQGAQINARNGENSTPLHEAARRDFNNVMAALIQWGANVNARNSEDRTPLQVLLHRYDNTNVGGMVLLLLSSAIVDKHDVESLQSRLNLSHNDFSQFFFSVNDVRGVTQHYFLNQLRKEVFVHAVQSHQARGSLAIPLQKYDAESEELMLLNKSSGRLRNSPPAPVISRNSKRKSFAENLKSSVKNSQKRAERY
ncbi:MAG: hypothetical protein K0R63_942 [Rickettsiales bacterium]|nr:hypothetical protein [Rickettsiales bacterium]